MLAWELAVGTYIFSFHWAECLAAVALVRKLSLTISPNGSLWIDLFNFDCGWFFLRNLVLWAWRSVGWTWRVIGIVLLCIDFVFLNRLVKTSVIFPFYSSHAGIVLIRRTRLKVFGDSFFPLVMDCFLLHGIVLAARYPHATCGHMQHIFHFLRESAFPQQLEGFAVENHPPLEDSVEF